MNKTTAKAMTAAIALAATVSQTAAGGYGATCYEKVHSAPVYKTVHERIMVSPGSKQVEVIPAAYEHVRRKVEMRPAQVTYSVVPAQYGWEKQEVLIEPARTIAREIPAVTRVVHRKVLVSEGGYTWEYQWIHGRKVLCKIKVPPRYETVAETVVVREARLVHETIPARYGYEKRQVLISPAYKERHVIPAEYGYVTEKVLVRPAQTRVHHTPPVFETVARQVKVSDGHSSWRPVRVRGHCG